MHTREEGFLLKAGLVEIGFGFGFGFFLGEGQRRHLVCANDLIMVVHLPGEEEALRRWRCVARLFFFHRWAEDRRRRLRRRRCHYIQGSKHRSVSRYRSR